jgi:hypothetical protein
VSDMPRAIWVDGVPEDLRWLNGEFSVSRTDMGTVKYLRADLAEKPMDKEVQEAAGQVKLWIERDMQPCYEPDPTTFETLIRAAKQNTMTEDAPCKKCVDKEVLAECMQTAWDTFVSDTGCLPDDFTKYERGLVSFTAGQWTSAVCDLLNQAATQNKNMGDAVTREDTADNAASVQASPATSCKSCEGLVEALEKIAKRPDLPNPERDADWRNCMRWSSHEAQVAISEHRKNMGEKL